MSKVGVFFVTLELVWCGLGLGIWATNGRPEWLLSSIIAAFCAALIYQRERLE